jgi:hypothetical protein
MVMNAQEPMMQFMTLLLALHKILVSMWDENNYTHSLQPHSTLVKDGIFTLPTLSLQTQHERIFFIDHAQLKDLLPPKELKPNKGGIAINTPLIISSF